MDGDAPIFSPRTVARSLGLSILQLIAYFIADATFKAIVLHIPVTVSPTVLNVTIQTRAIMPMVRPYSMEEAPQRSLSRREAIDLSIC